MNRFDDLLGKHDNQVVLFDMIVLSIDHDFRFSPGTKRERTGFCHDEPLSTDFFSNECFLMGHMVIND